MKYFFIICFLNIGVIFVSSRLVKRQTFDPELQKLIFDKELLDTKRKHANENQQLLEETEHERKYLETKQRLEQANLERVHAEKRNELLLMQQEVDRQQKLVGEQRDFFEKLHNKERQELLDKHTHETAILQEDIKASRQLLTEQHEGQLKSLLEQHGERTLPDA